MDNNISDSFISGKNFKTGHFCIIEDDVVVGDNVTLGHYVMLKSGTRLGNNIDFADKTCTTGACWIGDNVGVRTGAIISKANIICNGCFIGPGVITNHTKNVTHMHPSIQPEQLITYIGPYSIIGSQVSILAGVYIAAQTIVGGGAVIVKNLDRSGIYIGSPAFRKYDIPQEYKLCLENSDKDYIPNYYIEHLKKYMPNLNTKVYFDEMD
jgi:acetyltransferase-like isoleucine patch superfamily enzyme